MTTRKNLLRLLAAAAVISLLAASCGPIAEQLPALGPPGEGETPPEEAAPTEAPPEPEATEPAPQPEPTQPPPEPEPTTPPAEPQPTTAPDTGEPPSAGETSGDIGRLLLWGVALAVVAGIVIGVVFFLVGRRGEEGAPPELPSVPITSLVADIKAGRVSKVQVAGGALTITRTDGLVMVSRKEPSADLVQLLTNLGVTPEMMSNIIIEVEAPKTPTG